MVQDQSNIHKHKLNFDLNFMPYTKINLQQIRLKFKTQNHEALALKREKFFVSKSKQELIPNYYSQKKN